MKKSTIKSIELYPIKSFDFFENFLFVCNMHQFKEPE